jgi:hypothetical protein
VGQRVRVGALGVIGEVTALPPAGPAEVAVAGKRLRVPSRELVPLSGGPAKAPDRRGAKGEGHGLAPASAPRLRGGGVSVNVRAEAPAELNLVGLTVDEALPRVDKLLDEATVSNRTAVRIIHGFGQGTLRKAVAGLLQGHPQVASFRLGAASEGGAGATIVELKD